MATDKSKEAMKLALEALEDIANETYDSWTNGAKAQRIAQGLIPAIKEALAEQPAQQELVAWEQFYPEMGKPKLAYLPPTESTENACYTTPQPAQQTACTWVQPDSDHMPGTWQADCGAMWTFTEGGPKDNDMHFCPKCGKPTIEAAHGIKENA